MDLAFALVMKIMKFPILMIALVTERDSSMLDAAAMGWLFVHAMANHLILIHVQDVILAVILVMGTVTFLHVQDAIMVAILATEVIVLCIALPIVFATNNLMYHAQVMLPLALVTNAIVVTETVMFVLATAAILAMDIVLVIVLPIVPVIQRATIRGLQPFLLWRQEQLALLFIR